jgi:hypothetical protein
MNRLLRTTLIVLVVSLSAYSQLISDFQPAVGRSTSANGFPPYRLLLANSPDGINWNRTNIVLGDRSSVADGLVLPSGRILIYYVTGAKIINSVEQNANDIVMAVSDNNGSAWIYKDVIFNNIPIGATKPVDPNVVLLADGSIRMFVTIDPDQSGTEKPQTYSAISTDGGFTYTIEGKRFSVTNTEILDPENFRFSDSDWRLWSGGIPVKISTRFPPTAAAISRLRVNSAWANLMIPPIATLSPTLFRPIRPITESMPSVRWVSNLKEGNLLLFFRGWLFLGTQS